MFYGFIYKSYDRTSNLFLTTGTFSPVKASSSTKQSPSNNIQSHGNL